MEYVLILILKYYMEDIAVSQHTYSSQTTCEYAKAQTESLTNKYYSFTAICVKR